MSGYGIKKDVSGAKQCHSVREYCAVGVDGEQGTHLDIHAVHGLNRCEKDRKSTRLNSSHVRTSRMPSSA